MNIFIRSMGPIDESLQKFTFDCYFRQFWTDRRLAFNNSNADFKVIIIKWRNVGDRADGCSTYIQELPMNWKFLSKIWRPDTYFLNGKDSYLHKVVVPNRFIR